MTPAETLHDVYHLAVEHALADITDQRHVPATLVGVVCSPHNPPELNVMALLDARQVQHLMRAAIADNPAIFGFVFFGMGTVIHESPLGPATARPALLSFWVTRDDAGGASHYAIPGITARRAEPLPNAQRLAYIRALDPTTELPRMLQPPPS